MVFKSLLPLVVLCGVNVGLLVILVIGQALIVLCPLRHTTPEKFFIEACDDGAEAVLAIDRVSNEMTLTGRKLDCMMTSIRKNCLRSFEDVRRFNCFSSTHP